MQAIPQISATQLSTIIAAVGALGTAAFGLVDALKAFPGGGISRAGFTFIKQAIAKLTPPDDTLKGSGLDVDSMNSTLLSEWINGTATADQVNIAKSLVKLRLNSNTAAALAAATGVNPDTLKSVVQKFAAADPEKTVSQPESDAYGRFDLMLTTILDQAYQRASQRYRNWSKAAAVPMAVGLALVANCFLHNSINWVEAVLIGLISTPLAPIAKDVASAVQTASQAIQAVKKV